MSESDARTCPSCGQMSQAAAKWCEACGHDLTTEPKPDCVACGDAAVEPDGYCHSCGHRQPKPRDHVELTVGSVSAVSDRGRRHHHNEDAVAVNQLDDGTVVLVVCDGVSSTPGSADVSILAASVMAEALSKSAGSHAPEDGVAMSDETLVAAVETTQFDVGAASTGVDVDELNPPSTTLVAAVARPVGDEVLVSVVWLGDSRAYWVDGDPAVDAKILTVDHEINGALTRWLGVDAMTHRPETSHHRFTPNDGSELIVCSDGMWRYFDPDLGEPAASLVARLRSDGLAGLDVVNAMVDFANDRGGHDNISVARWANITVARQANISVDRQANISVARSEAADDINNTDDTNEATADDPPKEPMT